MRKERNMDLQEAIKERHSVREYTDQVIDEETREKLLNLVEEVNIESGLDIEIHFDDPDGFDARLARYGKFVNVNNYIVLKGTDRDSFEEDCGYYGEKIVLHAQMWGLNTCWAGLTYNRKLIKALVPEWERLGLVIALGYGKTQGSPRKSKSVKDVTVTNGNMPDWFLKGTVAALLAPTAMNQQKFAVGMIQGEPAIRIKGKGFYTKTDLGIVKYHFEVASGRKVR